MLAAKLQRQDSSVNTAAEPPSPSISELPGEGLPPQELPLTHPRDAFPFGPQDVKQISVLPPPEPKSLVTDHTIASAVSEMSFSDSAPTPSVVSSLNHNEDNSYAKSDEKKVLVVEPQVPKQLEETVVETPPPVKTPTRIHLDSTKLKKRIPAQTSGAGNVSLQNALLSAIAGKKHEIIEKLLDRGVSPDTGLEKNALIEAVDSGDLVSLQLLLEFGANPNLALKDTNTPLARACQRNKEPAAKLLLEYGADPNVSALSWSPLAWALDNNKELIVSHLLQYGADPDVTMKTGATALTYACERNTFPSIVEVLMLYSKDVNTKNKSNQTPLNLACHRNKLELIKLLLANGADPNLASPELPIVAALRSAACLELLVKGGAELSKRKGILELAVAHNQIESVKLLLTAGVDPNEKSQNIYSPLTTAIRDNRPAILSLLLSHGADPNLKGQDMPLYMATNRPEFLQTLLDHGADLKLVPGIMELATFHKSLECVKLLLDIGINPNDKKQGIYTPLTTAIRDNRHEILALLLSRGADPNFKGQDIPLVMATARVEILKQLVEAGADLSLVPGILESAVYRNNIESVKYLLSIGVDPNEKKGVYSPLTTAVRDKRVEILKVLLESGADPNVKGENWPLVVALSSPLILKLLLEEGARLDQYKGILELAVVYNSLEAVEILLDAGVDINEKHKDFYSPLTTAIRDNRLPILKLLLEKGADVNNPGETLPLIMAARFATKPDDKEERLKLLLERKELDVNAKWKGRTALMEACDNGSVVNVRLLLKRGADVNLTDTVGKSAMDIAANKGWDEIVGLLLDEM